MMKSFEKYILHMFFYFIGAALQFSLGLVTIVQGVIIQSKGESLAAAFYFFIGFLAFGIGMWLFIKSVRMFQVLMKSTDY